MAKPDLKINWDDDENPLARILPQPPLLSSSKEGWNNLQIDYLYQPAHETPEHSFTRHVLAILIKSKSIKIERKLDKKFYSSSYLPCNHFFLIPAGVSHQVWIHGDGEYLVLSLKPELLNANADESLNLKSIELIPQHCVGDPLISTVGLALKSQLELGSKSSQLYVESAANLIAAHLLQHYSTRRSLVQECSYGLSQSKLTIVEDYIDRHLSTDLSLYNIAEQVGMSQSHFSRLFKQSTGLSPWQYVIQRRVELAKQLLRKEELTIEKISDRLGFASHSQFTIFFQKYTSISPKKYRQQS